MERESNKVSRSTKQQSLIRNKLKCQKEVAPKTAFAAGALDIGL
jgi:hypothetical protein